ncbi:hypothetical protein [Candidatus Vondammii sp. HM_W22]|uniref:hypothetical protein n=1 Tax=Candidatus Vondammii sp. HM_W22 TaxID=2687299 RepID=UPI002E7C3DCA|nr:hypothetical protein [Candidatus Vondammii sp. HM_W22]
MELNLPDSHHLADSLLYLHQRDQLLEKLLKRVELFIQFGLPEDEHARPVRLLDEIRRKETRKPSVEVCLVGLE